MGSPLRPRLRILRCSTPRPDVLVFTTAMLPSRLRLVGHVSLRLRLSAAARSTPAPALARDALLEAPLLSCMKGLSLIETDGTRVAAAGGGGAGGAGIAGAAGGGGGVATACAAAAELV